MKRIRLLLIPVLLIAMAIDGQAQSATITPDASLTEITLDARYVDLVLVNDSFVNYSSLHIDTFRLVNAPPGLTIENLTLQDKFWVRINLAFDNTDFDVNYTDFRVAIRPLALEESVDTLKTSAITIYATVEAVSVLRDATLEEFGLADRSLALTLTNESFKNTGYSESVFYLINAPSGLSIGAPTSRTTTSATLPLNYTYADNDFDTDFTDFRIGIVPSILNYSSDSLETTVPDTIFADIETASVSPDQPLDEYSPDLNQRYVTVTLSKEEFTGTIDSYVNLDNAPPGVTKESVTNETQISCRVNLNYNKADFDSDITDFRISIDGNALRTTKDNDTIYSNYITVTAYDENPSVTITPDQALNEVGLGDRSLAVKLSDCKFSGGTADTDDIKIRNYPPGVTYSISGVSDSAATVNLDFNGADFDVNYTNFHVWINGSNLTLRESVDSLNSNQLTITAVDEPPAAYLTSSPSPISESNLNIVTLHVNLDQETFTTDTFTIDEFTIVNEPKGVTLTGFSYQSNTSVNLTLTYDGSDFDDVITDFRVDIDPFYLTRSSTTLSTDNKTIVAIDEPAVATFSPDAAMEEYTLQDRYLLVTVEQDTFLSTGSLSPPGNYFELDNEPTGLVIESVNVLNKNQAILYLDFTYNDFDANITDFRVIVKPVNLMKWSSDLPSQNTETITHYFENPVAEATEDAEMIEFTLDDRYVDIALTDEWFPVTGSVQASDFTLLNKPTGLTVQGIAGISKYAVRLNLAFTGADFDNHFDDFRISINKNVLIQSDADLVTDAMSIEPTHEPVITNVTIPDQSQKVGNVVAATITLDTDVDTMFTRKQGNIGGYAMDSLVRDVSNFNTYYYYFTINEGGTDYAANVDVPVNNIQMKDGIIFGNVYATPIANANDLIDAHTPVVTSILVVSQGFQKVGDKVFMVVTADGKGYDVDDAAVINLLPVNTSPGMNVIDNNNNSYTFEYTVQTGNQDVSTGNLTAEFVFSDEAGNANIPFTTVSSNNVSIDANPPVVDSVKVTSVDNELIIGETLEITIYTDGTGYSIVEGSTKINNVKATEDNITYSELSGGEYLLSYQVEQGDIEVTPGNLAIAVVMADLVGNKSDPPITTLKNNNVTILTTRPTANLAGTQQICLGDTADLNITFTGVAPWNVDYSDGTSTETLFGITDNPFYFDVITESAGTFTYNITNVVDATGNNNTGTGTAFVHVFELPVVNIVDLGDIYSVDGNDVPLKGDPAHPTRGEFRGVGVNQLADQSYYFDPGEAGVENSPHRIYYIYKDINGCVNIDSSDVTVISASANIFIGPALADVRGMACWYEDEFIISAINTANDIGNFTTDPDIPGFLQDNGDNTATLIPTAIDWDADPNNKIVKIVYHFSDDLGIPLTEDRDLNIIYFQTPKIQGLEATEYCSNEPLFPLEGTYPQTGIFTIVQGVGGNLSQGYTFNPAVAKIGNTWIKYTQQQTSECVLKDSVELTVHPSPIADFQVLDTCIAANGSWVSFGNTTDIATLGLEMESWAWDFGDFFNNFSDEKNPSHFYTVGGSRTIKLEATTIHGCFDDKEQVFTFGAQPKADFKWNTECFTGDDIKFTQKAQSSDPVSLYTWKIFNPDGSLLHQESGSELTEFEYGFSARDEYPVDVTVLTERNCYDSYRDTILLRPYLFVKATDDPYFEDFEADPPGWYSSKDEINAWGSWTFAPVTSAIFPNNASSGDHAWYTIHAHSDSIEQSWISSPCFNLKQTRRPMIRMNIKRSMERDRDGAVLQYTADNGTTWKNVGTLDDGSINWFNSFRINPEPGDQGQGWTGSFTFTPDQTWVTAKHELDELRKYPVVQFRIAYGSYGKSGVFNNKGFAFDDIWIGERSRLVLLEHFTNASDELSGQSNIQVNDLVDENNMDIIDIQYHVGAPGADRMYDDYPIGPSARSLYYGISNFPYSFMDGGGKTGTYRYNYIGTNLEELNLFTRVLEDPSFDITLDATVSGGQLNVSVTAEAMKDLPVASYTVHIAVIEKEISDINYQGGTGQLVFQNVVKQMLPDAGGSIFTKSWTTGDQETVNANWSFENVLDEDMIYVVAFVQNRETKIVYQSATNDPDANATSIGSFMENHDRDILVYPNPTSENAFIAFGKPVEDRTELKVYNHAGALVGIHRLEGGLNVYVLNVSDYKKGVYFIRVTDQQKVVGTAKLIVL